MRLAKNIQALAAVRNDDTLVDPRLDRLARSVPDAREMADACNTLGQNGRKGWHRILLMELLRCRKITKNSGPEISAVPA